jgi:arylamine N-acetyltransferase
MTGTQITPLKPAVVQAVLDHLGMDAEDPTPDFLDMLMAAYIRHVPWESASRIARRAQTKLTADCPRWPETFWQQNIESGTGGTCFESNYAFFSLLRGLGFDGYLTINNMGDMIGCHTAGVVVFDDDERWLVDVGIPLHIPIPLSAGSPTQRQGPFHTYTITPLDAGRLEISRDLHPRPYIFTLIDRPVSEEAYRRATTADYDPESGLFLNRIIVTRVINERVWRFTSDTPPYQLTMFHDGATTYHYIGDEPESAAAAVSEKFRFEHAILQSAFAALA